MPLLPIDLQSLFTQTYQVGKEQSVQKEAVAGAQAVQGSQIARQTDEKDKKVNEAARQGEGPEQVKLRARRERGRRRRADARPREKKSEPPRKKDVFQDPALGSHVDITG
jgi:hypothetical protein